MAKTENIFGELGSKEVETLLWSNPNTSASFSTDPITLSSAASNFEKIRIYVKDKTTDADSSAYSVTILVDELVARSSTGIAVGDSTSARYYKYSSGTSLSISQAFYLYARTIDNTRNIPVKVCGVS